MMNKEELLTQINKFLETITNFRDMLANDDVEGMRAAMRLSTERRAWFDK